MGSTETFYNSKGPDTGSVPPERTGLTQKQLDKQNRHQEADLHKHTTEIRKMSYTFLFYLSCISIVLIIGYCIYLYLSEVSKKDQLTHLAKLGEWGIVSVVSGLLTNTYKKP